MCVCYLGLLMGLGEEMSNTVVIKLLGVDSVCTCVVYASVYGGESRWYGTVG